jgi:hypothetical protein
MRRPLRLAKPLMSSACKSSMPPVALPFCEVKHHRHYPKMQTRRMPDARESGTIADMIGRGESWLGKMIPIWIYASQRRSQLLQTTIRKMLES